MGQGESLATSAHLRNRVPKGAFERLERHKWKHLRAVLRGLGGSNAPRLPGGGGGNTASLPDPEKSGNQRRRHRSSCEIVGKNAAVKSSWIWRKHARRLRPWPNAVACVLRCGGPQSWGGKDYIICRRLVVGLGL